MQKRRFLAQSTVLLGAGALLLSGCTTTGGAGTAGKRQEIDAGVTATLDRLASTVPGSRELLNKARGVLVFPSVLAAGVGIGGEYGEGALRVGARRSITTAPRARRSACRSARNRRPSSFSS
jgi:lipid-binding SYLF domain-containing protein